ncbi:carbohydrate-binding family 9-like protein [Carboxylicivirga taeanensis]|uniref:carbohydrate-binding family 9-like protein n=1 Tax=Carboxylicivirga taeanensis TaxID=1416875 RepID=UPI003F6E024F
MKQLEIKRIKCNESGDINYPEAIHPIDNDNWNYPADVKVKFGMAYDDCHLYLHYAVNENHPKAVCTTTNGPVWEDSCVEFFITFDDQNYYNLEFNCIGTRLAGFGAVNTKRHRLNPKLVESIETLPSLGRQAIDLENTPTQWEMKIKIPKSVFGDTIKQFEAGQSFKANFYKCGDKQEQMHFLSWNPISHEKPNFHLPQYFGTIKLV